MAAIVVLTGRLVEDIICVKLNKKMLHIVTKGFSIVKITIGGVSGE
jgi:hypothetical protein